jgi:nickel-dependent lactate racemase
MPTRDQQTGPTTGPVWFAQSIWEEGRMESASVWGDTIEVELAYGSTGLIVGLPADQTTVISPQHSPAAVDVEATLRAALTAPVAGPALREVVRPGQRIAVSLCDLTRPQPRELMVRALLAELEGIARREDFTLLVATGTHRGNTDSELRTMLGDDLVDTMRIVNHDARDDSSLRWMGVAGDNVPVWLNRHWVDADVRITTGFVEPHFFAGFSGGPKLVAPGLAGLRTVLTLHDGARIGHPNATWGICEGNPVHDDVRAIAAATGVHYGFDVVLNREQQVVAAFGGELLAMHAQARTMVRQLSMREVDGLFDIVVTSNSGFPLDQNLYQAVKGMSAAATIVKPGGLIICAAECRDGFPDHGSFREVLASQPTPQALLDSISGRRETVPDQWQVQVLARNLCHARIGVYSTYLDSAALRSAHLQHIPDIAQAVQAEMARIGPGARICVLPEGPQTIPYVRSSAA